ncbi:hypothetical protein F528_2559 [Neisseria meningitidis 992008]|nr:hypothetical protein F528_2559 [Neisseria meningitidis 992008]
MEKTLCNAPNLSRKAGKTTWEYLTYPRLKNALKRKFEEWRNKRK